MKFIKKLFKSASNVSEVLSKGAETIQVHMNNLSGKKAVATFFKDVKNMAVESVTMARRPFINVFKAFKNKHGVTGVIEAKPGFRRYSTRDGHNLCIAAEDRSASYAVASSSLRIEKEPIREGVHVDFHGKEIPNYSYGNTLAPENKQEHVYKIVRDYDVTDRATVYNPKTGLYDRAIPHIEVTTARYMKGGGLYMDTDDRIIPKANYTRFGFNPCAYK